MHAMWSVQVLATSGASKTELRAIATMSIVFNVGSVFEPSKPVALVWLLLGVALVVWFFLVPVDETYTQPDPASTVKGGPTE
jgi:hypothetical protein